MTNYKNNGLAFPNNLSICKTITTRQGGGGGGWGVVVDRHFQQCLAVLLQPDFMENYNEATAWERMCFAT